MSEGSTDGEEEKGYDTNVGRLNGWKRLAIISHLNCVQLYARRTLSQGSIDGK